MKIYKVDPKILKAAVVLLQESCPELSPINLLKAIQQYEAEGLPNCLTVDETAKWLKVDKRSVQNYIRSGKLKVIRFGQTVRVPTSVLMEGIDEEDGH